MSTHGVNTSDPSDILDGMLYVGNAACAELNGGDFDLVVNCTKNLPFPASENVALIRLPVDDTPDDALELFSLLGDTRCLERIDAALRENKKVLVHCMAGAQRSAAVAACFLVAKRGMDPSASIAHVRSRRKAAFFFGIVNFEKTIMMMAAST